MIKNIIFAFFAWTGGPLLCSW